MNVLYEVVLAMLPSKTIYWTLSGYMECTIYPSGSVCYTFNTWTGKKFHRMRHPQFHKIVDVCDFYDVDIETAIHMGHRNGWKLV